MKTTTVTLIFIILLNFLLLCCVVDVYTNNSVSAEKEPQIKTEYVYLEVPVEVIVEEKFAFEITSEEREMLARLVYLEARGESLECQKAVVSVVFNRVKATGKSIKEIIYQKGQFSPAKHIYKTTPNNQSYEAVDYVIKNGVTLPSYVKYFRANYHFKWEGYEGYKKIDNTYFGYLKEDKK